MAKAFAAGANYCMAGSLLSATDETPGEVVNRNGVLCKKFRGMASKELQDQLGKTVAAEGVSTFKKCKGPIANVLHELEWGVRSAFTYSGAKDMKEFKQKAQFRKVSLNTLQENKPHGMENL